MRLRKLGYAAFVAAAAVAFVIGAPGIGEAKGKKKEAAPASPPAFCDMMQAPVCGVKGGMKNTYANSCYARMDGAKVISSKACAAPKAGKKHAKKMKSDKKPAAKKADKKPVEKKPMEKKPAEKKPADKK